MNTETYIWISIGLVVLLLFVAVVWRIWLQPRRNNSERLPLTILQKRAWMALSVTIVFVCAIVLLFAYYGVEGFYSDNSLRPVFYILFFGMMIMHMYFYRKPRSSEGNKTVFDERDLLVLSRVPEVQVIVVIVSLLVWTISLTEVYRGEGAIPIVFPTLIYFSTLAVVFIAHSCGILIGYWKMETE